MNPRVHLQRAALAACLCAALTASAAAQRPDVYVFVLDDVAFTDLERLPTPNIDTLAARGTSFTRAYSMPMCGQTRHALLFSQYRAEHHSFECTGEELTRVSPGQPSLARAFQNAGYETVLFGKWNLGVNDVGPWEITPHLFGFEHWYAGLYSNVARCGGKSYVNWTRVDDGQARRSKQYVLEAIHGAAATWMSGRRERPRMALISFQTAHNPWRMPPASVLPPDYEAPAKPTRRELFEAGVRAADHVIGQLLELVPEDAWVVFLADNGTPPKAVRADQEEPRVKASVFEDGIRVPLIVVGPGVAAGARTSALVHVADVFPTLSAALGLTAPREDGVSFLPALSDSEAPGRTWLYSAVTPIRLNPQHEEAVVEAQWKLRVVDRAHEEFYRLDTDPQERAPLAADDAPAEVVARLRASLAAARAALEEGS